jgi:hypothetical protein
MKQNILSYIIIVIVSILLFGCPNPQKYPDEPQIDFLQFVLTDTVDDPSLGNKVKNCKLRFDLIDGDGDIGLNPEDTIGVDIDTVYRNNFLSVLYQVKNSDTLTVDSLNGYNFRIPDIQPVGQNKTIQAVVEIDMQFNYYKDTLLYDSVIFEFFIIDRALNKSNIEITPVLKLDTVGSFPKVIR